MFAMDQLFARQSEFGLPTPGQTRASGTASPDGGQGSALNYLVAAFSGVALFNSLELVLLIFITFSRRSGLYFWSLLIASLGVLPYSIGFLCYFFQLTSINYVSITLVTIGWWTMVTGQAVVLYSRLHLICRNRKLLTWIRNMIIVDAIILHIPTSTLNFIALGPSGGGSFADQHAYSIYEKIQMTGFCLQEFVISAVYMRETVRLMKLSASFTPETKKIMWHLIWINAIIIVMDLGLLGIEYASLYRLETTLKGLVYSVKLRLEFAVLSQLVAYTHMPKQGNLDTNSAGAGEIDTAGWSMRAMSRGIGSIDTGLERASTRHSARFPDPSKSRFGNGRLSTSTQNARFIEDATHSFAKWGAPDGVP